MKKEEFIQISAKIADGSCSEKEIALYNAFYDEFQLQYNEWGNISGAIKTGISTELHKRISTKVSPLKQAAIPKLWYRLAASAVVFITLSIGLYFYLSSGKEYTDLATHDFKGISPGTNKAVLILASGEKIDLTAAANKQLARQAGVSISKTANGQLVYKVSDAFQAGGKADGNLNNTIATPAGGQYQVILPDGTRVTLNSASSMTFPAAFAQASQRNVEVSGEAYFEVSKDKQRPFRVKTANQLVEVLGTHFNINAYHDEPVVVTTLLEGSVKINNQVMLRPGEQAMNSGSSVEVQQADMEKAMAWKNGDFVFKNEDFKTAMRKISRWYDVEILYDPAVDTDIELGGWVSMKSGIATVLSRIESTGNIHFKVQGRRITVTK
jgi:transmembrane sensor